MTETLSYPVQIFMAGDYDDARRILRDYCYRKGYCFHLTPADYIYTGGEESGIVVGLINYPRFPKEPVEIWAVGEAVARELIAGLHQKSATIQAPDRTKWITVDPPGVSA